MWWIAGAWCAPFDVDAMTAELVPLVEKAAGRTFDPPPQVQDVSLDALRKVVAEESVGLAVLLYPNQDAQALNVSGRSAYWTAPSLLGKYGLFDQTVYLSRAGLKKAHKGWARDVDLDVLTKCVLAHELAHALHAQSGAFERTAQARDEEALVAMNALSEGWSVVVHEEVCTELGGAALIEPMRERLGVGDVMTPYGVGHEFVQHHKDHVWDVLSEPPTATRMLHHPDTWGAPLTDPPAVEATRTAAASLGSGFVFVKRASYHSLATELAGHPEAREALSALREGTTATTTLKLGSVQVDLLDFGTPEAAARFVMTAKNPVAPESGLPTYAKRPDAIAVGDGGFEASYAILSKLGRREVTRYVAHEGPYVGLVTLNQASRSKKDVLATLATLFEGLAPSE